MKQRFAAPQMPAVAYARACATFDLGIGGFAGASSTKNLFPRHLGMRMT